MQIARRDFLSLLGAAAVVPRVAAQPLELPVIGFLHAATVESYVSNAAPFAKGLAESGFAEAQNLAVEYRFANGGRDRLAMLAADLVDRQAALIVAGGGVAALAAKATPVPIVAVTGFSPIALGLAASLDRPGGNVTGATFPTRGLIRLGLAHLRDLVPAARTVGYLGENAQATAAGFPTVARGIEDLKNEMLASAAALGLEVAVAQTGDDRDYEKAFATFVAARVAALVIAPSPVFAGDAEDIIALALRYEIPTLSQHRDDVVAGGLMSCGASRVEAWRRAGVCVGEILKGATPSTMPIARVDTPELAINLTIATAFGLTVPPALLAQAEAIQ
jgi:putative ABC transport system substrate-binding protein